VLNLGGEKIFLLLVIALVVLGPEKLPEAARKIGNVIRQVKAMSAGFEAEVRKAIDIDGLNPFADDPTTLGDTPFTPEQVQTGGVPSPDTAPVAELETDIRAQYLPPEPPATLESTTPLTAPDGTETPSEIEAGADLVDSPAPSDHRAVS
jgi:sec-independent protein translocase protein TatB